MRLTAQQKAGYNDGMQMLRLYIAGLVVLGGAILVNLAASAAGLITWYDFLAAAANDGLAHAIRDAGGLNLLFLALLYPAGLGGLARLGLALAKRLSNRL